MTSGARRLTGACLCRAVAYEVTDAFEYAMNCHCADCRRATGAAFKSFAGIARDKLAIVKGGDKLLIFGNPAEGATMTCTAAPADHRSIQRCGTARSRM